MTPRRPHLLPLLLPLAVLPLVLSACSGAAQDPVALDGPTTSDAASPEQRLPDDLSLDHGLDRSDADATVEGPSRTVPGTSFPDLCDPDPTTWPGASGDRLAAVETGPEYLELHEVLLYADEATAQDVLDGLRTQVDSCPESGTQRYATVGVNDATTLTFGMHFVDGLGGTVWRVTRHGDVLLVLADSGEASEESLRPMAADLARTHATLWSVLAPQLT